jgi:hypothetical protein
MCEYLITLVGFCAKIAKAVEKPAILQLTCPFIVFFDTEASEFEAELHVGAPQLVGKLWSS